MLMFLFNDIPSICHVLLVALFLVATRWTIWTIKAFWVHGSKQKSKKYLTPCLTSLQGTKNKGTDSERSSEDLNLEYTLRTLDRNIQYIAWQMQRIAGWSACSSTSSSSVKTVASVSSCSHSSAGSQSGTPPSPGPTTQRKDAHSQQQQQPLARPPAIHRISAEGHIRMTRILRYKEQELLNWHIQKKHQQVEVAPLHPLALTGNDRTQAGGAERPLPAQRSRSHTPPQSNAQGRRTPPKSPRMQSPGPFARPLIPGNDRTQAGEAVHLLPAQRSRSHTPPESNAQGRSTPPKSPRMQSPGPFARPLIPHKKAHESAEVKVSGRNPKEQVAETLTPLGQSKSPALRESERPGTPKERKKDSQSPGRRPGSPKEDLGRVGRVGSPKDKQVEAQVSQRTDQTMHTLSWTNMPECQKPSLTWEQLATAQPKFLDPYFMCQNQLELPCMAAVREEKRQKSSPFAQPPPCPSARTAKPQCLAHTILQSVDSEQAMRDLQMHLAKGAEMGHGLPSVEYPLCLLCGRCVPYCPHPRTRHSPSLLVYPRLDVHDGSAYMTLGFLLKLRRSDADKWGLKQETDVIKMPRERERPSKRDETRRIPPRRKSRARAAGPRSEEPKTPVNTLPVARELFPKRGDRKTRPPVVTPQASRVTATSPAPATRRAPKTHFQLPPARPPRPALRPSPTTARPGPTTARPGLTITRPGPTTARKPPPTARTPPLTARQVPTKTLEEPPSILKQLLFTIKRTLARVRQEAEKYCEAFCPKKSSPSKKAGIPQSAPLPPKPHKKPGALALEAPTSVARMKGEISNTGQASPLSTRKQEASPIKSATPWTPSKVGTPILKHTSSVKHSPATDHKGRSLRFKEPESPWSSRKGASSHKKFASPKTPKKSPRSLRRTSSRLSTPRGARSPDSD